MKISSIRAQPLTTFDKCGLPIKSATTGGKYEEFHPVFWVLPHRCHRIQGQAVVAVAVVVDVVFVVIVVVVFVVVVVQWC